MTIDPIKMELIHVLADIKERIREFEAARSCGTDRQRIEAAGELQYLRHQRQVLEARLEELGRFSGGRLATLVEWLKEEWLSLSRSLEDLVHRS